MKKPNMIEYSVFGRYALFADPLSKTGGEKISYQIPTYQALKGITESIYWKPTIVWYIDECRIMNEIRTESKGIRPIKYQGGSNDLSFYNYLRDVEYRVRAHFEWNENRKDLESDRNENKHHEIARRMVERGGRRDIFLGTRECQGYVEPCAYDEGRGAYDQTNLSFGVMVHGITYSDEAVREEEKGKMTVRLWNAQMTEGVIRFPRPEECEIRRILRDAKEKEFIYQKNFQGLEEFEGGALFGVAKDIG